jgi:hypothetical protein
MRRLGTTLALAATAMLLVFCGQQGDPAQPLTGGAVVNGKSQPLEACDVAGSPVTGAKIKACYQDPATQGTCLDELWKPFLDSGKTAQQALALLQCYEDHDEEINVSCHPVSHAIGRDLYLIDKTIDKSFADCDQTCHSGCYHGVMERFLNADNGGVVTRGELEAKIATACEDSTMDSLHKFQCLHGLGHAVLYYELYELFEALKLCDLTGGGKDVIPPAGDEWARSSCRGGVFMENIVAAEKEKRVLSPTDVHYPCDAPADQMDPRYINDCYAMQTSRMTEMGLTSDQIMVECTKTGPNHDATYEDSCTQSMGRDLSDTVRGGDPKKVSSTCEKGQGTQNQWCTRGVLFALIDNTWDGKWAYGFCATYATSENVDFCYSTADDYLMGTYSKKYTDLVADCGKYANNNAACLAAANARKPSN